MRALSRAIRIAETQFGVVTRRQLIAGGVSAQEVKTLVRSGALATLHRGVYVSAGSARTIQQLALAACLVCGDGAVASFTTAAALMGVCPAPEVLDVTVGESRRPRPKTIRTHRSGVLGSAHVTRSGPLMFTNAPRTLADLAGRVEAGALTLLTDEVLRRRLVSAKALRRYVDLPPIRVFRGIGTLRAIADDRLAHGLPESDFEGRMVQLLTEYGLPRPERQYSVLASGRRVRFDLCYPDQRVVVELDGWDPHSAREQWESDHERQNAIELAGWRRLAFTWQHVNHQGSYVAVTVAERLGLRPRGWVSKRSQLNGKRRSEA